MDPNDSTRCGMEPASLIRDVWTRWSLTAESVTRLLETYRPPSSLFAVLGKKGPSKSLLRGNDTSPDVLWYRSQGIFWATSMAQLSIASLASMFSKNLTSWGRARFSHRDTTHFSSSSTGCYGPLGRREERNYCLRGATTAASGVYSCADAPHSIRKLSKVDLASTFNLFAALIYRRRSIISLIRMLIQRPPWNTECTQTVTSVR